MIRLLALAVLAAAAASAHADLYRYRDPQTGQLKLTNVPPPWLKGRSGEAAGPRTEVIRVPAALTAPPRPAEADEQKGAAPEPPMSAERPTAPVPPRAAPRPLTTEENARVAALDRRRIDLLEQLFAGPRPYNSTENYVRYMAKAGEYYRVIEELAKLDPAGMDRREFEDGRRFDAFLEPRPGDRLDVGQLGRVVDAGALRQRPRPQ